MRRNGTLKQGKTKKTKMRWDKKKFEDLHILQIKQ